MSTRRCLRCCKLVPEVAAFCRRCGLALKPEAAFVSPPAAWVVDAQPDPPARATARGGPAPALTTLVGMLVVAGGLGFLASSNSSTSSRCAIVRTPVAAEHDGPAGRGMYDEAGVAEARERLSAAGRRLEAARQRYEVRMSPPPPAVPAPTYQPPPAAAESRPPAVAPPAPSRGHGPKYGNSEAPRITWVPGVPVRAGQLIGIRGAGMGDVRRVLFVAGPKGRSSAARAEAAFQSGDDASLIARVPDLGADARDATVVVFTPRGAAVAMPDRAERSAPTAGREGGDFLLVRGGTTLEPATGATLFVEPGATVSSPAGSVVLVRAGGGVDRARTDCLVIRETSNPQVRNLSVTPVLEVPALNACFVDKLIQYAGR